MAKTSIDLKGNVVVADEFRGTSTPGTGSVTNASVAANAAIAATKISVAAGTDGLTADDLQGALQAIWTELAGKVDA